MWLAISTALGPGTRLVAASRSRKCSRLSQRRRETVSCSMRAMWAAGPPKLIVPSFRNRPATSNRLRDCG